MLFVFLILLTIGLFVFGFGFMTMGVISTTLGYSMIIGSFSIVAIGVIKFFDIELKSIFEKRTWKECGIDLVIIICIIVCVLSGILGGGFTKKQQAVMLCEREYRESESTRKATKGSAWDVSLYKDDDGTYSVSFNKDLVSSKSNGVGGIYKNTSFYCDGLKLLPIPLPIASIIAIIILLCYEYFILKKVPFKELYLYF